MVLGGVPIAVLPPDHPVVGRDAGQSGAAEIDVGGKIHSIVRIVHPGFGSRTEADQVREGRIEIPIRDVSRRVRRNGRGDYSKGVGARIRLQQVQPSLIGLVLRQMKAEP